MTTDQPGAATHAAPESGNREGRLRIALSIGATAALLTSYFTAWWHVDTPPPDNAPFVPFTIIFNPEQGISLYNALPLVAVPLLAALLASLTLRGSHEARRLFANFGLMAGFLCLEITIALAFQWCSSGAGTKRVAS